MTDNVFERLVLPVASEADAAASSAALLPYLRENAAAVLVVHVVEKAGGAPDKASVEQRERLAEAAFDAAVEALGDAGITDLETRTLYSTDVAEAIFEAAGEFDATAIAFSPRGGSRWKRLLTGDVALSLITEADRPVIVLPEGDADGSDRGVTTDG